MSGKGSLEGDLVEYREADICSLEEATYLLVLQPS